MYNKFVFFALLLLLFLTGCLKDKNQIAKGASGAFILGTNTIVVTPETNNGLVRTTPTTLVFQGSPAQLSNANAGSILASTIVKPVAPNGYLRKIISISQVNGQTVITTQNARLEEAIKQCSINYTRHFTIADTGSHKTTALSFGGQCNMVLYDADGNLGTTGDQITTSGNFSMEPDLVFGLSISGFHVDSAKIGATITENADISITANLINTALIDTEINLYKYYLEPFDIGLAMGLPIPIIVTPQVKIDVGADVEISGSVTASISATATQTAYEQYDRNNGWQPIFQKTYNPGPLTHTFSGDASAKVFFKPILEFSLYDMDDLQTNVASDFYLIEEGNCTVNTANYLDCNWDIKGGIDGTASIKASVFGFSLLDYDGTIFDYNKILFQNGTTDTRTHFNLSNGTYNFTSINDCQLDSNQGTGSSNYIFMNVDNSVFDPTTQIFDVRSTTTFDNGKIVTLYYSSSDPSVTVSYNSIQLNFCTRFGSTNSCVEQIEILNNSYISNPFSIQLFKPAGAYKTNDNASPSIRARH